ncbi:ROK family protein [Flavilitoribacter nigricans]|uniref:Sugar kinase n=1 Tax=Flavilitoribacter nigricans (strain ATCC 23147 / DSM 23189 / NBRC 102662 / NCIMB 1420 / SS-2) TaxID=1122177 RepID=A0A2D0NFU3_FLAN2|nr:ROK family protein [Flavilitoribacter nigricans]PHN07355.1 sugar kinase [Flavilitoribacter nigricans DSM 23189 = NBRC 102662]
MDKENTIIGVDLGGTKVEATRLRGTEILQSERKLIQAQGTADQVLQDMIEVIQRVWSPDVSAIGIGVPSIVDVEQGIVYDVQNIPSWKEVPLKAILEAQFECPVAVNNDANCFALGEKHFGEAKDFDNVVGLIVGTGIAGGIIINGRLYTGRHCGAGEFGMLPYLDHHLEYYASGQYFANIHGTDGAAVAERAMRGDATALSLFKDFGYHLASAVMAILYTYDPEVIVMGGSVSKAYPFFAQSLQDRLKTFAYPKVIESLQLRISQHPNIAVLGAAMLCYEAEEE